MATYINHESSRKAFETSATSAITATRGSISITNLAERHLRLRPTRPLLRGREFGISITNLAERHLRLIDISPFRPMNLCYINHESSRKAFETGREFGLLNPQGDRISITNLAERHLRLAHVRGYRLSVDRLTISITNLAERHLRPSRTRTATTGVPAHINHESSRKAFETPRFCP